MLPPQTGFFHLATGTYQLLITLSNSFILNQLLPPLILIFCPLFTSHIINVHHHFKQNKTLHQENI